MNLFSILVTAVLASVPVGLSGIGIAELVKLIYATPAVSAQSMRVVLSLLSILSFVTASIFFTAFVHGTVSKLHREVIHAMEFWPYR